MRKTLTLQDAVKEASRCLLCEDAPCSHDCPAGTDPGKFVRQIRFANYKGAARTVRNNNILGAVCAFTCPVEKLCEKNCTSKKLGAPIDISGLQRFACDYGDRTNLEDLEKVSKRKEKIAVIGSGPAGIACAAELLKAGFSVTLYEKEKDLGGVPNWGVPSCRLPKKALANAISQVKRLGAQIKLNSKIESESATCQLLSNGYSAVFVAIGLSKPISLNIFGNASNVISANDFLKAAKLGSLKSSPKGKRVIVIGGGSVAMDAAVTAAELGAKYVATVSLEHVNEMPADIEEQTLAKNAGVIFKPGAQITRVVRSKNKVTALKGVETEWKKRNDLSPSNAVRIKGTEFDLLVDLVIEAIGSKAELHFGKTKGIFVGGDINGGKTIANAVGDGKAAAKEIIKHIENSK